MNTYTNNSIIIPIFVRILFCNIIIVYILVAILICQFLGNDNRYKVEFFNIH